MEQVQKKNILGTEPIVGLLRKFGGTIYQYSGSHGCINLPVDKAKLLYEKVYKGMPVLCHN